MVAVRPFRNGLEIADIDFVEKNGGGEPPDLAKRLCTTARRRVLTRKATRSAICRALERAGIEFIDENGGGAGVRFKERGGSRLPSAEHARAGERNCPAAL